LAGQREARRATELDPENATAWQYFGLVLAATGQDEEAITALRRALELDPSNATILSDLSWISVVARRYQETLDAAFLALELEPGMASPRGNAGEASLALGHSAEALRLFEEARRFSDHPWTLASLGAAFARVGRTAEALTILDSIKAMSERRYVNPRAHVIIYLGLDSLDTAMEWLIRAAEVRDPGINLQIRHPKFDVLRGHPRYPELMRLMRLEG
jgi:tetratricopeptide (TPR) repeat protein